MVVVGKSGSGKTTLLLAALKETVEKGGEVRAKGTVAFVEQEPYIFSGSIKDNITFGRKYDKEHMEVALEVSQLKSDIELFAVGIDTTIGERGLNVSGG